MLEGGNDMHTYSESSRLRALRALEVLDVQPDVLFTEIVQIAQQWFDLPMVSITLVDADRQWRVAYYGPLQREDSRDGAICPVAMYADDTFVVTDTTRDPRFAESPYVTSDPRIRFYAASPLRALTGEPIGSFCVMDTRPCVFDRASQDQLAAFGLWVETELNLGAHRGSGSPGTTRPSLESAAYPFR